MPLLIMLLWTALVFSRSPSLAQALTMLLYTSMSHLTPCQVVAHRVDRPLYLTHVLHILPTSKSNWSYFTVALHQKLFKPPPSFHTYRTYSVLSINWHLAWNWFQIICKCTFVPSIRFFVWVHLRRNNLYVEASTRMPHCSKLCSTSAGCPLSVNALFFPFPSDKGMWTPSISCCSMEFLVFSLLLVPSLLTDPAVLDDPKQDKPQRLKHTM